MITVASQITDVSIDHLFYHLFRRRSKKHQLKMMVTEQQGMSRDHYPAYWDYTGALYSSEIIGTHLKIKYSIFKWIADGIYRYPIFTWIRYSDLCGCGGTRLVTSSIATRRQALFYASVCLFDPPPSGNSPRRRRNRMPYSFCCPILDPGRLVGHERSTNGLQQHCGDVIMCAMASQITSVSNVYSTVCSGADQRKHQRALAFVRDWWIPLTKCQ